MIACNTHTCSKRGGRRANSGRKRKWSNDNERKRTWQHNHREQLKDRRHQRKQRTNNNKTLVMRVQQLVEKRFVH